MILEWLQSLRTRSSKTAREWGYVYQNVSLKFRARRCAKAWRGHLEHSRAWVREQMQRIQPKSVMVIGSGLLLEVPREELLKVAERVYLVDLVHAPEIRKWAARNPKITLIEKDISGLLGVLRKDTGAFQIKNIPWEHLPPWDLPSVDLVISANLLSQIPLLISETVTMSSETYERFARAVRDQHLERLLAQAPQALLFADFETRYIDRKGQCLKSESFEVNLRTFKADREWLWEIAPFGESSLHYRVEMRVKAFVASRSPLTGSSEPGR